MSTIQTRTSDASTNMMASRQWASRPDDQRFTSLIDLNNFTTEQRNSSRSRVVSTGQVRVRADLETDTLGVVNSSQQDGPALTPTHYAFGQLASLVKAPAGYLRTLPAPLAADCLNLGLIRRDVEEVGLLMTRNDDGLDLRAATGPNYGRVWNSTITSALVDRFGDGITGNFRVPGEFGKAIEVTKANTTLFASDRDMFVFLADETRRIEIPNRRNGQNGSLARGFMVWNSEVGSQTLGVAMFLFDYVCANRIIWGQQEYREIRIRHTAGAPDRWIDAVQPQIEAMSRSSDYSITQMIAAAQQKKIDDVTAFLAKRKFTGSQIEGIRAVHAIEEGRPIESLWDAQVAVTAYAKSIQHQDSRIELEREGGRILAMAA
jgi:hypothetical protein